MTPTASSSYLPIVAPTEQREEQTRCQISYNWIVLAQIAEFGVMGAGVAMLSLSDFKIAMIGGGVGIAGILSFALTTLKSYDYT